MCWTCPLLQARHMATVFTLLLFDEQQVCWWSSLTPQPPPHLQVLNQPQKLMGKVIFNGLVVSQQGWGNRFVPQLVVKSCLTLIGSLILTFKTSVNDLSLRAIAAADLWPLTQQRAQRSLHNLLYCTQIKINHVSPRTSSFFPPPFLLRPSSSVNVSPRWNAGLWIRLLIVAAV